MELIPINLHEQNRRSIRRIRRLLMNKNVELATLTQL
jgi:hypothetical protein